MERIKRYGKDSEVWKGLGDTERIKRYGKELRDMERIKRYVEIKTE